MTIYAMLTVGDVVAEETAVCAAHVGQAPRPAFPDVDDGQLVDCSDNSRLRCRVCEA